MRSSEPIVEMSNLKDAAEMLWGCLANVSGGDWTQQSEEWQEAVVKARDYYMPISSGDNLQRITNRLVVQMNDENIHIIAKDILEIFEGNGGAK